MSDEEGLDDIEWTPYAELHLINSIAGLKAIGPGFHMCLPIIWERFTSAMGVNIKMEALKRKIATFYDIEAANRLVGEPPIPKEPIPFSLPADEFPECQRSAQKRLTGKATRSLATKGKNHSPKVTSKSEAKSTDKSTNVETPRSSKEKRTPIAKKRSRGSEKLPTPSRRGKN